MTPLSIDVVPIGKDRVELRHAGRVIRTLRKSGGYLDYVIGVEERRLKAARAVERPCITCGTTMLSEGPHHRMCNSCRAAS